MQLEEMYLTNVKKIFHDYKSLGEKAMQQLDPPQLFHTSKEDCNSIAMIVKHLHGNMLSRWTDFLTTDGEKPGRNRDGEFENNLNTDNIFTIWNLGWQCLFTALDELTPAELMNTIHIRQEPMSAMSAINRQLAHYAYHVGQIVFAAKELKQTEWNSLSIPLKKNR